VPDTLSAAVRRSRLNSERIAALVLLGVAGLALALYLRTLETQSLWFDEGLSVAFARRPLSQLLQTLVREDLHPPLYYLVLHVWMTLAGTSEWAVRLPSALSSVLLIPLAYAVVQEVGGEGNGSRRSWKIVGLAGSALIAFSPFLAYYAQETRMYSMAAALALAATWSFLKAARTSARNWWLLFAILVAAGFYTLYFSAFLVAAFWVYAGILERRLFRPTILATFVAALLAVPWLPYAYQQIGRLARSPDYWTSTQMNPGLFVRALWTTFLPNTPARLGLIAGAAGLLLLFRYAHQRQYRLSDRLKRSVLLFLTAATPAAMTYAVVTLAPKFAARYTIVTAAPLYVCAALMLYPLLSNRVALVRYCAVLVLAVGLDVSVRDSRAVLEGRQSRRDDARSVAAYLSAQAQPQDVILLVENAPYALTYYYAGVAPMLGLHVGQDFDTGARLLNNVMALRPRRAWVVLWHQEFADPTDMTVSELMRVGREVTVGRRFFGYGLRAFDVLDWEQSLAAEPQPEYHLDGRFAPGLAISGFDILRNDQGWLHFVTYWTAETRPDRNYSLTLSLLDRQGNVYLRSDGPLSTDYFLPPAWPLRTVVRGRMDISLPSDLPAIPYRVAIQVYDPVLRRNVDLVDDKGALIGQTLIGGEVHLSKSALQPSMRQTGTPHLVDMAEGLRLLEYAVAPDQVTTGGQMRLTIWWQNTKALGADPTASVRLMDASGLPVWHVERQLIPGYPVNDWQGEEINRGIYELQIPSDLGGGKYQLQVGVGTQWTTLRELTLGTRPHVYERPKLQYPLDLEFDRGITLLGYTLDVTTDDSISEVSVTLYWRADAPIDASYKVSVQVVGQGPRVLAQHDSVPVNWTYPTAAWLPGEIVADPHLLILEGVSPSESPALFVVLYNEASAERLHVRQNGNYADYATLTELSLIP